MCTLIDLSLNGKSYSQNLLGPMVEHICIWRGTSRRLGFNIRCNKKQGKKNNHNINKSTNFSYISFLNM